MNAVSGRNREEDPNAPVPVEETSEMEKQQQVCQEKSDKV